MIWVLPALKICFADGGQAITCYASGCIQQAINLLRKLVTKGKAMEIYIRNAKIDEYGIAESIMKQVQQMHIGWRPDIYKYSENVLPIEMYEQAVKEKTFFVAEYKGTVAGVLFVAYQHIENPNLVTRDIIFIDSMAVDEKYRGKGIGHAFFDFLKELKKEKGYDGIELQVNAKNEAACKMYADYGLTIQSINMEL